MKIYNKKTFVLGILATVLGLLNLFMNSSRGWDFEDIIMILFLLFFGLNFIFRSLSRKFSREDKLNELDERNQLVELKSKSMAFRLTQILCFFLMFAFLIMGNVFEQDVCVGMGVGLAVAYSVSMLTEIFAYFYYEKHS